MIHKFFSMQQLRCNKKITFPESQILFKLININLPIKLTSTN